MASGSISNHNWKKKDSSVTFANLNFNELLCELSTPNNDVTSFTFHISKDMLDSNFKVFRSGYYMNSTFYGDVYLQISNSTIGASGIRHNGQNQPTTLTIYYR